MITIELTEQQAMAFRLLSMAQAWDLKNGSVTLHFDSQGTPVQAETRSVVYNRLSTPPDKNNGQTIIVAV